LSGLAANLKLEKPVENWERVLEYLDGTSLKVGVQISNFKQNSVLHNSKQAQELPESFC